MSSGQMLIASPNPQKFLTQGEGIGGIIKSTPEDFLVEEIPLYEPCGKGEHLYLQIEKTSVSHGELMSCLRRHFGVKDLHIGYAGMKDKHAVTSQTVSVHLLDDPPDINIDHKRIKVLWAARHTNKLKRGHLRGNRFVIRIRSVDPLKVTLAKKRLEELQRTGMPNFFGPQRFGYRCNNHLVGAAIVRGDWQAVLDELLGITGTPFPDYQQELRELYDQGNYKEAAGHWTVANRNELIAIRGLRDGKSPSNACYAIGKAALSFFVSSLQSAIFNRVLDERIEQGTLQKMMEGDLAFKHDSRSVFKVTAEELVGDVLADRLARFEISPSGPLWGAGMTRTADAVGDAELRALEAAGITFQSLVETSYDQKGARRALRVPIENTSVDGGVDEEGSYIRLAFDLSRGSYATVLLREIMQTELDDKTSFTAGE